MEHGEMDLSPFLPVEIQTEIPGARARRRYYGFALEGDFPQSKRRVRAKPPDSKGGFIVWGFQVSGTHGLGDIDSSYNGAGSAGCSHEKIMNKH